MSMLLSILTGILYSRIRLENWKLATYWIVCNSNEDWVELDLLLTVFEMWSGEIAAEGDVDIDDVAPIWAGAVDFRFKFVRIGMRLGMVALWPTLCTGDVRLFITIPQQWKYTMWRYLQFCRLWQTIYVHQSSEGSASYWIMIVHASKYNKIKYKKITD